ncbi:MAG: ATP-binding cassette domain-containing protein, partial [Nitrospirota bacterium]
MIDIINLHKSFNSKQVLRGVNLHIERGETMVVIGGSGSGKSVLMKHIIGLLTPDEGSVKVDGVDIFNLNEGDLNDIRKKFGMLFQGAALFDSLMVWENVGFALMQHTDFSKEKIREIAGKKLEMVGLR